MSLITWSDFLSVGVVDIDNQHKKILQLINGLHHHLETSADHAVKHEFLNGIVDFLGLHFNTEERLMHAYGFPDALIHIQEHRQLLAPVIELQTHWHNDTRAEASKKTMLLLKDWLFQHMMVSDKHLGEYLYTHRAARDCGASICPS